MDLMHAGLVQALHENLVDLHVIGQHDSACYGLQIPKHLPRPPELLGVCVTTMLADAPFHELAMTLAQVNALGPSDA